MIKCGVKFEHGKCNDPSCLCSCHESERKWADQMAHEFHCEEHNCERCMSGKKGGF